MKSKIVSFETACEITGRNPKALPDVSMLPESDQEYHTANHMLLVIAEGLRKEYSIKKKLKKDWKPDYTDGSWKYETRFWIDADKENPSGFGFSGAYYVSWNANTDVGSRFAFPNSEIAIYFGEQFADLHKKTKLG